MLAVLAYSMPEFFFIVDAKAEVRCARLDGFDPKRERKGNLAEHILVERINWRETGDAVGHNSLLLETSPIFMFTLEDTLKRGRTKPKLRTEDWQHGTDRKVGVSDYGIDGTRESPKFLFSLR